MIRLFPPVLKRLFCLLSALRAGLRTLSLFLLLMGCHAALQPADYPHAKAESALIAPDLCLTMTDGQAIPLRLYPAAHSTPRAVILALHGFGDSRDAWETLAPTLTADGVTLIAPDLRGFGQASAPEGWSSTSRLLADAASELRWAHGRWPHTPLYVMGESMGGALALLLAAQPPETRAPLQGVILLAPAVFRLGSVGTTLLALWNAATPALTLSAGDAPGHRVATGNLQAMRRLFFDPLTTRQTTVHALHGLVELMQAANARAPKTCAPLLVIWGGHDDFVPAPDMAAFLRRLPPDSRCGAVRRDALPEAYHLLSREKRFVGADIASWLFSSEAFLPSGGDAAAAAWQSVH